MVKYTLIIKNLIILTHTFLTFFYFNYLIKHNTYRMYVLRFIYINIKINYIYIIFKYKNTTRK